MPIFEFECQNCKTRFEQLVRSPEEKLCCPNCSSVALRKLISRFSFASKDSRGNITSSSFGCSGCFGGNCSDCHSR
ncbi:MAG: zinc ribbon domain-containing protein [Candidatus Omnitrophica bacterium]|nr:zinc ribbon domain-containing protein [Candidatus Omnitrophota bacterium]